MQRELSARVIPDLPTNSVFYSLITGGLDMENLQYITKSGYDRYYTNLNYGNKSNFERGAATFIVKMDPISLSSFLESL